MKWHIISYSLKIHKMRGEKMLSPIVVKIFEVMPESFVVALGKKIMNGYIKKYADLNIEGYEKI